MSTILTSEEGRKRENLKDLLENAAIIVRNYISKFHDNPEYKVTIEDLEVGYRNLMSRSRLFYKKEDLFIEILKEPKEKRGGFGLSRGFEEFLLAMPKEDKYWVDEILNAVDAVEDYYREM